LNEATKVLYRVLKWRLSKNDCKNRGYILLDYPKDYEETNFIFKTQKNLKRKKPKKKKTVVDVKEEEQI